MNLLDLLFPEACLSCGKNGTYICNECVALVGLSKPVCPNCEKASIDGVTHAKCLKKLGLNGLFSIWNYEGVIRKAILAFKYKHSLAIGSQLANIFYKYLKSFLFILPKPAVLVPIPIFWYRQNLRGFNQSEEIGKILSERAGIKFEPNLLIKKKTTIPQVELKGRARRKNLEGVFSLNPERKSSILGVETIILFDDVYTTGSTLLEATKVLKRSGVKRVWGLTVAR